MKFSKVLDNVAEFKIRLSRGQGLMYEFRNAVLITAGLKVMLNLNTTQASLLALFVLAVFYVLGYIDLGYIKLYQKEQILQYKKYNPHLKNIAKKRKI